MTVARRRRAKRASSTNGVCRIERARKKNGTAIKPATTKAKKKNRTTHTKKKDLKAMSESNRKKKRKAVHTVFSPTMNVCVHVDAESGGSSPRRHRRRAATIVGVHRRGKYKGGTRKKKRSVVSAAFHCNLQAAGHVNFTRPSLGFFSFPPFSFSLSFIRYEMEAAA